jgi:hypothetical protein
MNIYYFSIWCDSKPIKVLHYKRSNICCGFNSVLTVCNFNSVPIARKLVFVLSTIYLVFPI